MNDLELDEMLNTWSAPAPPATLPDRMRAEFRGRRKEPKTLLRAIASSARRGLLAAAILGTGAFLLVVTEAVPQTMRMVSPEPQPPFTVDSQFVQYAQDGSATVGMYATSFNDSNGHEVILSRSLPNNPLGTSAARTFDAARRLANPLLLKLAGVTDAQLAARKSGPGLATGCANDNCLLGFASYSLPKAAANPSIGCVDGTPFHRETILSYPTAATQITMNTVRMTVWMAPELGCFALKVTMEDLQPNGTFRLTGGKQAIKITLNP